ncbi:MAG: deoxynucleoside kinase [bacterium]
MFKSNFIAISGNIGVGKTSLSKQLNKRFGWKVFYEPEQKNPYLEDFYEDMQRWAFHSQIVFLTQRFKDHLKIQNSKEVLVQDRTIFEDAEIFARNLYERNLMQPRDYQTYCKLYESMVQTLEKPGLLVYLRASTWTLLSRIRKRGRDYERNLDREYLAQLNISYDRWIRRISADWSVLIVDTDDYDMVEDEDWLEGILEEIKLKVE